MNVELGFLNLWKSLSLEFSFSKTSPLNHFWVFPLTHLVLKGAILSITHYFLKEIWTCCINVVENSIVWEDLLSKALFIIINPIIFQSSEVYALVNTACFKFKTFSCRKEKLMIWQTYINGSFLRNSWRETY